jgi:hypothetical protein
VARERNSGEDPQLPRSLARQQWREAPRLLRGDLLSANLRAFMLRAGDRIARSDNAAKRD